MNNMKIAAVQMVSGAEVEKNLRTVNNFINLAVEQNVELLVLPENFSCMGMKETDKLDIREQQGDGPIQDFLKTAAKDNNLWIVGGTIPIASGDDDRIIARCQVYNNQGQCVGFYDKMHLFDVKVPDSSERYSESDTIQAGSEVVVLETPFGKTGLAACYDLRFPELFRQMLDKGAELLVVPSAFTELTGRAHWELLVRTRALENTCYMIAANQGGIHINGRETYGHSMIVDPWGRVLNQLEKGLGLVVGEIDPERVKQIRENFPSVLHRKL